MITKTKIGIISLVIASFVIGGFAFSAYQVGAFGGGRMFGFFRGAVPTGRQGCDLSGLEKGSPEWQAKMEECKSEREAKMEERKTEMEAWKDMTPEERQAKMEEFKANLPENGEWTRLRQGFGGQEGRGFGFGPFMGLRGFKGMSDEVNYEVVNIANGVQITITSDNADIVKKLQDVAARYNQ